MSVVWLCTILLAVLSCSARPNTPPGFLVGNAEGFPTSRRIDLSKYLQDVQEYQNAVSKVAKDAKQYVAAMKRKQMQMIRQHFLQPLPPIPYTTDRLHPHWSLQPNIPPCLDCLPIKHNINPSYQPLYSSQTEKRRCNGSMFTCLQAVGSPSYQPTGTDSANKPCLDKICNQAHKKPLGLKPLYSNGQVLNPTVINNHNSISTDKISFNNVLESSEPTHHTSPTRLPVSSKNTKPTSFQFTLQDKLFNPSTNPTTQKTKGSIESVENLKTNSSILENIILELEPFETNKQQTESSSSFTLKDNPSEHETVVPEYTTVSRSELEITTHNSFNKQITTQKLSGPAKNTLVTSAEEELQTESTTIYVDRELIDVFSVPLSNNNQQLTTYVALGKNEATLPTAYEGSRIKEETIQQQTTDNTSEWDETENIPQLKTTVNPLIFTGKLSNNKTNYDTSIEPSDPTIDNTSAAPLVHERVNVTNDDTSDKTLKEQDTTDNPYFEKQASTTETSGTHVNLLNESVSKVREDIGNNKLTGTTSDKYDTNVTKTESPIYKNDRFSETTPTDSSLKSNLTYTYSLEKQAKTTDKNGSHGNETTNKPNLMIREDIVHIGKTLPAKYNNSTVHAEESLYENNGVTRDFPETTVDYTIEENPAYAPSLERTPTPTVTNGTHVHATNELNLETREDIVYTPETTNPVEYDTTTLKTAESLHETNDIAREYLERKTVEPSFSTKKDVFSYLQKHVTRDGDTTEYAQFKTTENVELELSAEFPGSDTMTDEKSARTSIYDIEETTASNENIEEKSYVETTVLSVDVTNQGAKNLIFNIYENKTENTKDFFGSTTLSSLYNTTDNNSVRITTEVTDFSEMASNESVKMLKEGSKNSTVMNGSKTVVSNLTKPDGIIEEQYSYSNPNETEKAPIPTNNYLAESPTPASITDFHEPIIESRSEVYASFNNGFETSTNIEYYFESSTQPFDKSLDDVDWTDVALDYTTGSIRSEEQMTEISDLGSSALNGEPVSYQNGVLKFNTELDSETVAYTTDISKTQSSLSTVLENTYRNVLDKTSLHGGIPTSPMQAVKQCIGLVECLVSNNRSKRSLLDNFEPLSSAKNISTISKNPPNLPVSPTQSKEKRLNAELSSLYGPALLELLPMVREGYRNNAFNEDDKKVIKSIFGDLESQKAEEIVDSLKEAKGDLLMKDATARMEDEDYDSSEYRDMSTESEHILKRSKNPYRQIRPFVKKIQNHLGENSDIKESSQRYTREIRSSQPFSEASAILALLTEQSDVQRDGPDEEEEDYYEYYEDEGGDEGALEDDFSVVDMDEDYEEPSFVELIKLARRHSQRGSRQES